MSGPRTRVVARHGSDTGDVPPGVADALPDYLAASNATPTDSRALAQNIEAWRKAAGRSKEAVAVMADRLGTLRAVINWLHAEREAGQPLDTFRPTPDADAVAVPGSNADGLDANTGDAFPPVSVANMDGDTLEHDSGDDFPALWVSK